MGAEKEPEYNRIVFDATLKKMGLERLINFDPDAAAEKLKNMVHDEVDEAAAVKPKGVTKK